MVWCLELVVVGSNTPMEIDFSGGGILTLLRTLV
jgi:hypothetical protein